jgi:CRP-like cAMP-binding protein
VSERHLESNVLLRTLEPSAKARFTARLHKFELVRGQVLHNLGDSVEWVHFPRHGLIAVMAETVAGESVESGMVGREGALGIFEACGSGQLFTRAVVQVGGEALRMSAASYRELFVESAALRTAVHKYVEFLIMEARQFVLCNALHTVESRLCRSILDALERSGLDRALPVTQESLAQMLGAQRTTIAACVSKLYREGVIKGGRGSLEILDRPGLERLACCCRETLRYARGELQVSEEKSCEEEPS